MRIASIPIFWYTISFKFGICYTYIPKAILSLALQTRFLISINMASLNLFLTNHLYRKISSRSLIFLRIRLMWLWNDFSLCIDFPILFSRFWNIELDSLVSFEFFFFCSVLFELIGYLFEVFNTKVCKVITALSSR